jgi:cell division protein FtsQ
MFGKSKKFARQWKLEVRSRSKPLQAVRLRMAAGALAISAGVVLCLMVCWKGGEYLVERYVYTNPALGVQRITISTDGIIPAERIRAWVNVKPGQNLLSLDLSRIKRDLELVPLIGSVAVERVLPSELVVNVRERQPIARIHVFAPRAADGLLERSAIFLDEEGVVIPEFLRDLNSTAFEQATRFLPVITGVGDTSFRPGHKVPSQQILAALKWIKTFESSGMTGQVDVREIDISSPSAVLVTTEQGNEIAFAYHDFEGQIVRWRRIQDFARQNNQILASLDLVVTNYVPVVWAELTNAAPAAVRAPEVSPYKRKNV